MRSLANEHSEQTLRKASDWFARLQSGNATAQDHVRLAYWLSARPEHREAYAFVSETCRLAAHAHKAGSERPLALAPARTLTPGRRRMLPKPRLPRAVIAGAAAAAAVTAAIGVSMLTQPATRHYETAIGETRDVALDDGTTLVLNGATKLDIMFTRHARDLDVKSGEFFVTVGKDPKRPFRVHAAGRIITDVGTAFDVDTHGREVGVAVSEGAIMISSDRQDAPNGRPEEDNDTVTLSKGQALTFAIDRALGMPRSLDPQQVGTWRVGILTYDHSTLEWLVADLNRRFNGVIAINDPQLAAMPVTLTLKLRDRDTTIATLEKLLPIQAVTTDQGTIELVRSKS